MLQTDFALEKKNVTAARGAVCVCEGTGASLSIEVWVAAEDAFIWKFQSQVLSICKQLIEHQWNDNKADSIDR